MGSERRKKVTEGRGKRTKPAGRKKGRGQSFLEDEPLPATNPTAGEMTQLARLPLSQQRAAVAQSNALHGNRRAQQMAGRLQKEQREQRGENGRSWSMAPAAGLVQRENDGTKRKDYVFIMGKKGFFKKAKKHFSSSLPDAKVVTGTKTFNGIFSYLSGTKTPIGNLYIVTHASPTGLKMRLSGSDKDKDVRYGELRDSLKQSPETYKLPPGLIDKDTTIHIKGCRIGQSDKFVELLDEAFGGKGRVIAPTHLQGYTGKGEEFLGEHYFYVAGEVTLDRETQVGGLQGKYAALNLSEATWEKIVPKKGLKRTVERYVAAEMPLARLTLAEARDSYEAANPGYTVTGISKDPEVEVTEGGVDLTYTLDIEDSDGEEQESSITVTADLSEVEADAKQWVEDNLANPETFEREVKMSKKGIKIVYTRTLYEFTNRPLKEGDDKGKEKNYFAPPLSDRRYYNISNEKIEAHVGTRIDEE